MNSFLVGTARCAVRALGCRVEWPFADAAARRPYQFGNALGVRNSVSLHEETEFPGQHHSQTGVWERGERVVILSRADGEGIVAAGLEASRSGDFQSPFVNGRAISNRPPCL
jgi:hypothetical protein